MMTARRSLNIIYRLYLKLAKMKICYCDQIFECPNRRTTYIQGQRFTLSSLECYSDMKTSAILSRQSLRIVTKLMFGSQFIDFF